MKMRSSPGREVWQLSEKVWELLHMVDGLKMLTYFFLFTSPFLLGYETCDYCEMVSKLQIEVVATLLIVFGAHNQFLIEYQREYPHALVNGCIGPPNYFGY